MARKISLRIYLGAFQLSASVFLLGVYVGQLIDEASMQSISEEVATVSQMVASVQLLLLREGNSSSLCPTYLSELDSINSEIENMGYRLSYLEEEKGIYNNELKKQYFILEAESYLLSKKAKTLCGDDSLLLLYFYSNKNCTSCRQQGYDILQFRDEMKDNVTIKIYSFDGDIGSPVAESLMEQYGVSVYPSVVLDDRKLEGYSDIQALSSFIKDI